MTISEFKAGKWVQQFQYRSFQPAPVNHEWVTDEATLSHLLSRADIRLGELNAFSILVPDADFFIRMHVRKEATTSSRIEGTQTNMQELLQKKEYIEPEKRQDWLEVKNYVEAMNESIRALKKLPLSSRLLRNAHERLMRGEHKMPGSFRTSQNWIGGASINDAVFIPPAPDTVIDLMSDLELFMNNEEVMVPDLIKIGILHYQFETIHPFLDGNGRIGRLLITLFLVSKGILVKPTLYLSDFFEKNKALYYDNLMRTRTENDLVQWLKFFLEGVRQTAESSVNTFSRISDLRNDVERKRIVTLGKKISLAQQFLNELYRQPIMDAGDVAKVLEINASTAMRLIADFERLKILSELTGYRRNRLFAFKDYIKLFS